MNAEERSKNVASIWADDQLGRRSEANFVEKFLVDRHRARKKMGLTDAYTLAVDAKYGIGKSYFLRRLADQLALTFPVAFIDAWADDTADDPFGALVFAVTEAMKDKLPENQVEGTAMRSLRKAGGLLLADGGRTVGRNLAKLSGRVLVKAAFGGGEDAQDALGDALADISDSVAERLTEKAMDAYRKRRDAVESFRTSLSDLMNVVEKNNGKIPLFIIVDELDRCRPTYAVAMLEEVKHLFAVPDIVFIFGIYGKQLQASIKALYGSEFEAGNYLRRFIQREYELPDPDVEKFVLALVQQHAIELDNVVLPPLDEVYEHRRLGPKPEEFAELAAQMFTAAGMTARDIQHVMDFLAVFIANWDGAMPVHAFWLIVQATTKVMGISIGNQLRASSLPMKRTHHNDNTRRQININEYVRAFDTALSLVPPYRADFDSLSIEDYVLLELSNRRTTDQHPAMRAELESYLERLNDIGERFRLAL